MTAEASTADLVESWTLPYAVRLGSSVRSKGVFMEVRSQLPKSTQKALTVKEGGLTLRMPTAAANEFKIASDIVRKALASAADRLVIPRELEDILGISTSERRRWLADGRVPSAGTRTLRLRGRGEVTFHIYDPRLVQDILARDVIHNWREDDAEAAAENRRRAAWKAKLRRDEAKKRPSTDGDDDRFKLKGWAAFEREGLLR